MYASPADLVRPTSWPDAVRALQDGGDGAKAIAGGQSLIPMMSLRLATPTVLVDLSGVDQPRIAVEGDRLVLSALTRHADLERSHEVATRCPMLAEAAGLIGNIRVRHRGTIGGSLAHADPAGELPCAMVALGATVRAVGPAGERAIPAAEFFDSYFTTTLGDAELVTAVEIPIPSPRTGWAFVELLRRAGDFAVVEVAALIELDGTGRCVSARIVGGGVGERPVELAGARSALIGAVPDERTATEAGRLATAAVQPSDSVHASAGYRAEMLGVFVRRAIAAAVAGAGTDG